MCVVCFQKLIGAGDVFDAEMDSSDDDGDRHQKLQHVDDAADNEGENVCTESPNTEESQ